MRSATHHTEALLHWLWKNRCLPQKDLATAGGKKVAIHHPGYLNPSDGPDFTNARIRIDALMWHGDVEIHWASGDWFAHHHQTDKNYNRVILHVIYEDAAPRNARCQDRSTPPTLVIKPFLPEPLQYFLHRYRQADLLPCAGNIAAVPPGVIEEQFDHAHHEYFEQKVNDLMQFYDPALPLSRAWVRLLVIALFDGLGISHNREPMKELAQALLDKHEAIDSEKALTQKALRLAGIHPKNEAVPFNWKRKGSRPANHPETRIPQACNMFRFIQNKPFNGWQRTGIKKSFDQMMDQVTDKPGIGSHQAGVLFGTVWLPAFYLLGKLTGRRTLCNRANEAWAAHRTNLPNSITKHFYEAEIPTASFERKLGSVHQYRAYCQSHRCDQCRIFNYIISA